MAPETDHKKRELSAEEKLRAADRELAQLREILASMDEIDALRKRDGKPASSEYGGYKRMDVSCMIAELERRRHDLLIEISNSSVADNAAVSSTVHEKKVTLSDALERLYAAIVSNIERNKSEILREIRYSCRQNTAIYTELSMRMDALADQVAEKINAAGIDYDDLARRIVVHMTGKDESATVMAMEKRIAELETALASQGKGLDDTGFVQKENERSIVEGAVKNNKGEVVQKEPMQETISAEGEKLSSEESFENIPLGGMPVDKSIAEDNNIAGHIVGVKENEGMAVLETEMTEPVEVELIQEEGTAIGKITSTQTEQTILNSSESNMEDFEVNKGNIKNVEGMSVSETEVGKRDEGDENIVSENVDLHSSEK